MLTIFERIVLYILILIAIYIFVKTSELKIRGIPVLKLKYRLLLALFFPLVLVIGLLLSSFFIAIILVIFFIIFLYIKFFKSKNIKLSFRMKK